MTPKRIDKDTKRDALVAAAAAVFAARGYRNATMEEIAQAAGVAKGTLYLYFQDKEALGALLTGAIDGLFLQCWSTPSPTHCP